MAEELGKCAWIDKKVVEYANTLSMKEIYNKLVATGDYQKLPSSMTTFRKYYYDTFLAQQATEVDEVGKLFLKAAKEKEELKYMLEYLERFSPAWQKKTQIEVATTDDLDEEETALDILSGVLGLEVEDDEEEGDTEPTEEAT